MNNDIEKYEKIINESPLFDISKDKEPVRYENESRKMIGNLYCYLYAQNPNKDIENAVEFVELAKRCIKSFDKTKGVFLHYFNKSWKQEKAYFKGEKKFEKDFKGLKFSENDKRIIKRFKQYAKKYDNEINMDNFYKLMSEALQKTLEETIEIAEMASVQFIDNEYSNDDGEVMNVSDNIGDTYSILDDIEDIDKAKALFEKIEELFDNSQERQKPIIADMMTCDLVDELMVLSDTLLEYNFINKEILKNVENTGEKPSQRDIAKKYSKNEASISRTMREFKGKLKEKLKR